MPGTESIRTDPISDLIYGTRPLKRVIQHLLLDPLNLDVLNGKFIDGDVILADVES